MPALSTIKNRRDFVAATNNGKRFAVGSFALQMRKRPPDHPVETSLARIGFTVTKKMGNAVKRNRIKRRLREAARLEALPHMLPGHDYVIVARQKALDCDFSELKRDMAFAFSKIITHKQQP